MSRDPLGQEGGGVNHWVVAALGTWRGVRLRRVGAWLELSEAGPWRLAMSETWKTRRTGGAKRGSETERLTGWVLSAEARRPGTFQGEPEGLT